MIVLIDNYDSFTHNLEHLLRVDGEEVRTNMLGDGSMPMLVLGFESADHPVDAWMARALELVQMTSDSALVSAVQLM